MVNLRLYKHKFDKYVDIKVKMSMVWLKSFMIGYFLNTDFDITYENFMSVKWFSIWKAVR